MKLLANENFPVKSFKILKAAGYDITHINFENPSVEDEEVVLISIRQNRIIITFDSDYGALVFQKGMKPPGVIYLRFKDFTSDYPGIFLINFFKEAAYQLGKMFTVIDSNGSIRQRVIT